MKIERKGENELLVNNHLFHVEASARIEEVLEIENFIYVMINFPNGHQEQNNNVWKIDNNGKIIWKIKKFGSDILGARPFIRMNYKDGKLKVENWQGVDFYVNLETGDLQNIGGGRPW